MNYTPTHTDSIYGTITELGHGWSTVTNTAPRSEPVKPRLLNLSLMGTGKRVSRDEVRLTVTPESTPSWKPIPHHVVIDLMKNEATRQGLTVVQENHLLSHHGDHYFGLFQVTGDIPDAGGEISTVLGLRNAHDKAFGVGLCVGDAPFVCSNLCFNNEIKVGRKHTVNLFRDLPNLMKEAVSRFVDSRQVDVNRIERLKNTRVSTERGDSLIWKLVDNNVLTLKQGHESHNQWHRPEHEVFLNRSGWSLQNAFTNVLRGERNPNTHLTRTTGVHRFLTNIWK